MKIILFYMIVLIKIKISCTQGGHCDILKDMENKLFKYELHCHTGCVSRCGRVEPEEIVKLYIENGYDGIVVTDD